MSAADLHAILTAITGSLPAPTIDPGRILTLAGLTILATFLLYALAKTTLALIHWIANLTPQGFAKLMLATGIILLTAGLILP